MPFLWVMSPLTYRVAESLGNVMRVILFNLTITCTIVIALNLFVLELNESISIEMVIAFADMNMILLLTFGHFYLSEWITLDLLRIGDHFYNSAWYRLLSVKQQKLLVLPIQRAQREIRLKGLAFFECSLLVFSSVNIIFREIEHNPDVFEVIDIFLIFLQIIRTASSYYIVIRSFK